MARSFTQEHLLSVIADVSQQEEHKRKISTAAKSNRFHPSTGKSLQQEYKRLGVSLQMKGAHATCWKVSYDSRKSWIDWKTCVWKAQHHLYHFGASLGLEKRIFCSDRLHHKQETSLIGASAYIVVQYVSLLLDKYELSEEGIFRTL